MKLSYDEPKTMNQYNISTEIVSLAEKEILSRYSRLTSATKKGLTVHSNKKFFLVPERDFIKFLNHPVELFLSQYELPFYGIITKIYPIEKDLFEIRIDFMENTPLYYRECVEDLLN